MTRTARSNFPRAVQKDRHSNRTGIDPNLRKGGAGGHNWGNVRDEREIETEAFVDELENVNDLGRSQDIVEDAQIRELPPTAAASGSKPILARTTGGEEDLEEARKMRKNIMHKKNVDLSAIARTSVVASTSPPRPDNMLRGPERDDKQIPISSTTRII